MQPPENDLNMVQSLVPHNLGSPKRGVELTTLLVTLVHVCVEMVDQCLRSNEPRHAVGPGLSAFILVDVRDEKAGNGDAVLDGGEVLAELWINDLVLEITSLSNGKGHPAVEKTDPVPEKGERLGR